MKQSEKLFEAVTNIRDDIVEDATTHKFRRKRRKFRRWLGAVAAVLALCIALGSFLHPESPAVVRGYALAEAVYPEMALYPDESSPDASTQFSKWHKDILALQQEAGYSAGLEAFWTESSAAFLGSENGENKVCSPVNIYLALAMLTEVTGGNTRQQLLDVLSCSNVKEVRRQANQVWTANYRNDGLTTSLLASSLWLDNAFTFNQDTVNLLAENYYTSTYQGDLGTAEMDMALQNWLNEQTGNLLSDQIGNLTLDPLTVLALATTIQYRAQWSNSFSEIWNEDGVFHGADGDTDVTYMKESVDQDYYWSDQFSAVSLRLESAGGRMWLLLPNEGVAPETLLKDEQAMQFIHSNGAGVDSKHLLIHLSVPKFDVMGQLDLIEGLQSMGITDVFDFSAADFSPVTDYEGELALRQATHGARVTIDEEGVTAAAYTVLADDAGAGEPPTDEVDFVLDRPFLFVITGADGEPMFVGIVNQI